MDEFDYSELDVESCWYKKVCTGDCNKFCQRHYKMSYLVWAAGMRGKQCYPVPLKPGIGDGDAFATLKDIKSHISDFVVQGKNLLIYSNNTGNGKTEWSKKLLLSWFDSIWSTTDFECRGLFVSMPKLMPSVKDDMVNHNNAYFQGIKDNLKKADLVVWDEINYKEWTSFEQDFMLDIISERIAVGKSNIYTTNYVLDEIERRLGTRLSSRIVGTSKHVEFKGRDQRHLGVD